MFRYGLLSLCFLLVAVLCACEQGGSAVQQKIGVVNINRIMVDSTCARAAAKYMENMQNSVRARLTELQGKAEDENAENEALQNEVKLAYAKMQAEQQNVQSILNDLLHRTVETYRKEHGFTMILFSDVVLSFEEAVDVTSDITAAMNKENVEFKPLPEPRPEAPEAAASPDENAKKGEKKDGEAPKPAEKPAQ